MTTHTEASYSVDIDKAHQRLEDVAVRTPLQRHAKLSQKYGAEIYLKREDLQVVRSYKIRGAYNLMSSLPDEQRNKGVICASAGNHAQGVAYSCARMKMSGIIYMPAITPKQKIGQVKMFGEQWIDIVLIGDTYDECQQQALKKAKEIGRIFIPPFDHPAIVEGQGTVAREIIQELPAFDYLFVPVGGGGLCAGVGLYLRTYAPEAKLIGAEPKGAPSMFEALKAEKPVVLDSIQRFVDGAAVKQVGEYTFSLCKDFLHDMLLVPEGKICSTILQLYNQDAIVVEPAGALTVSALDQYAEQIKGKKVVCVVSGGNNDIDRMQEIKERSLLFEGLKHYFIVRFAQRPGALKEFVNEILSPTDDIVRFEFIKKNNKESGPALIGIEVKTPSDYEKLVARMDQHTLNYTEVNQQENLFEYLV